MPSPPLTAAPARRPATAAGDRPTPPPAARLPVTTCIACGSMFRAGTCEGACLEERVELVRAADLERVAGAAAALAAFRAGPPPEDIEAYNLRRAALPVVPGPGEPERVVAYWCPRCGAVDAPQPCLGVCIRPTVEWVDAASYDHEARAAGLVRRIAAVTPRPGRERETWLAFS